MPFMGLEIHGLEEIKLDPNMPHTSSMKQKGIRIKVSSLRKESQNEWGKKSNIFPFLKTIEDLQAVRFDHHGRATDSDSASLSTKATSATSASARPRAAGSRRGSTVGIGHQKVASDIGHRVLFPTRNYPTDSVTAHLFTRGVAGHHREVRHAECNNRGRGGNRGRKLRTAKSKVQARQLVLYILHPSFVLLVLDPTLTASWL